MSNSENVLEAIQNIGEEMARQSNLSTQYPLWVVMEKKKDYVSYKTDWEQRERDMRDDMDEESFSRSLCDRCYRIYSESEDGEIPEECPSDECDEDSYRYFNVVDHPNLTSGMYLTQKACQQHIDENHYHYNDAYPYAYSAWRNPEMIAVMQFILKTANQGILNHYK